MKGKTLIAIATGIVIGVTAWYFFIHKPKQESKNEGGSQGGNKSGETPNKAESQNLSLATADQFDKFVNTANSSGADIFSGLQSGDLSRYKNRFMKKIIKDEADFLIKIVGKKEADWTSDEKSKFQTLFNYLKSDTARFLKK